ncbi:hypothetical protein FFLO_06947 [Filobasidium floriforme]|uniref:Uncharacterized protein n=1 Tax=Filobasidium floriforme TaxID=5210 RepID=A0A8K0JDW8_9TREE|nr:uncharacterized protein HD553DRAFT_340396 [Filobasidium floriforme]KAG7527426.1 hypothetical protein FFLO_06947 [Filobasidium floriforme]KAH8087231.1 hypothetical protein HD553DRAFT_340396 [Filobasidium floriforme]
MSCAPNDDSSHNRPSSMVLSDLDFLGISRRELTLSSATANSHDGETTSTIAVSGLTAVTERQDTADAIFKLASLFGESIKDLRYGKHEIAIGGGYMRLGLEKLVKRYVSELQRRSIESPTFRSGTFRISQESIKVYMMGEDPIEIYFDLPQQAQDVKGIAIDFRAWSGPHAELARSHANCNADMLRAAVVSSAHVVVATANTGDNQEAWAIYHRKGETRLRVVGWLSVSAMKQAEPWAAE